MLTKYGTDNIIVFLIISILLIFLGFILHPDIFREGFKLHNLISYFLLVLGAVIILFTFWFFRDPDRKLPVGAISDETLIISPADGKVVGIKKVTEDIFIHSPAFQISIFLSPLDVHVNRIPVTGIVKYFKYHPGNYFIAWEPKSSELNEQTHIGVENGHGKVFFKQIVGILARRLVWDIKEGDTVSAGQRFGMMKFGSRMDVIVPEGSQLLVKQGDKVFSGETIIAKLK